MSVRALSVSSMAEDTDRSDASFSKRSSNSSSKPGLLQRMGSLHQICSSGVKGRELVALPRGYQPTPHDIICGRGRGNYNCPGNLLFRQTTGQFVQQYLQASSKSQKTSVLEQVVAHVKTQNTKCRFIKKQGGSWFEIGDILAREKAGHVMREWCTSKAATASNSKRGGLWDAEDPINDNSLMSSTHSLPSVRRAVPNAWQEDASADSLWEEDDVAEHFELPARLPASAPALFTTSTSSFQPLASAPGRHISLCTTDSASKPGRRISVCTTDSTHSSTSGYNSKTTSSSSSRGTTSMEEPEDSMDFFIPPVQQVVQTGQRAGGHNNQHRISFVSTRSATSTDHDSVLDEMTDQIQDDSFVMQLVTSGSTIRGGNRGSFTLDNGDLSRSSLKSLHSFAASTAMRDSNSSNRQTNNMRGSASMRASGNSYASEFSRFSMLSGNTRRTSFASHRTSIRSSLRSSTNSNKSSTEIFGRRVSLVSNSWQQRRISMDDSVLSAMKDEEDEYACYDDCSTELTAADLDLYDSFAASTIAV